MICTYLITSGDAYKEIYLDVNIKNSQIYSKKESLRVFNSKDLLEYRDYYILNDQFRLRIGNQKVWGFCLLDPVELNSFRIEQKDLSLKRIKDKNCAWISEIKEYNNSVENRNVQLSRIIISLFAAYILFIYLLLGVRVYSLRVRPLYSTSNKLFVINLISSLAIITSWFYIIYPIITDDDFIRTTRHITVYTVSNWFSYLNDLIIMGGYRLWDNVRVFSFMSLATSYLLVVYLLLFIKRSKLNDKWMFFISIMLLNPSLGSLMNYMTRDLLILYGNIFLAFFIILNFGVKGYRKKGELKNTDFIAIIIAFLVSEVRREEIIVAVLFLVIFIYLARLNLKKSCFIMIFFIVLKFSGSLLSEKLAPWNSTNRKILVTISHYVGTIVTNSNGVISDQDKKVLRKHFNLDKIRKYHTASDAQPTFMGGIIEQDSSKSLAPLYKTMFRLIKENFWITVKGRLYILYCNLGADEETIYTPLSFEKSWHVPHWKTIINSANLNYINNFEYTKMKHIGSSFLNFSRGSWQKYIFYNGSLAGLILFFIIIFYKKFGVLSLASLMIFSRVPVFFILTPAAQFKYLADIYIYCVLLIPFVLYQLKMKDYKFKFKERPKPSF